MTLKTIAPMLIYYDIADLTAYCFKRKEPPHTIFMVKADSISVNDEVSDLVPIWWYEALCML